MSSGLSPLANLPAAMRIILNCMMNFPTSSTDLPVSSAMRSMRGQEPPFRAFGISSISKFGSESSSSCITFTYSPYATKFFWLSSSCLTCSGLPPPNLLSIDFIVEPFCIRSICFKKSANVISPALSLSSKALTSSVVMLLSGFKPNASLALSPIPVSESENCCAKLPPKFSNCIALGGTRGWKTSLVELLRGKCLPMMAGLKAASLSSININLVRAFSGTRLLCNCSSEAWSRCPWPAKATDRNINGKLLIVVNVQLTGLSNQLG
mmetsp:Transcript_146857/g.256247  ORF Transcript_146857/g.256247 Transcript_146857/m.256247 type:complete len:266 (-) Transcript_146857:4-801(-)